MDVYVDHQLQKDSMGGEEGELPNRSQFITNYVLVCGVVFFIWNHVGLLHVAFMQSLPDN